MNLTSGQPQETALEQFTSHITWLIYLVNVLLILSLPILRNQGLRSVEKKRTQLSWSTLVVAKLVLSVCTMSSFLLLAFSQYGQFAFHFFANSVGMLLSTLISLWRIRTGINSSGVQHVHAVIVLFLDVQLLWDDLEEYYLDLFYDRSVYRVCIHIVAFVSLFIYTVMLSFSDPRHEPLKEKRTGEKDASFFSQVFYSWVAPIISTGYRRPIEVDDLFALDESFTSEHISNKWFQTWTPKLEGWYARKAVFETSNEKSEKKTTKCPAEPSIFAALFRIFKWEIILATLMKILSDTLQFANPYLLHKLIGFLSEKDRPMREGLTYVVMLFVVSEVRSVILNKYFYIMFSLSFKISTALTAAVYRKTLRLSSGARRSKTVGEIVNLMSIDIGRFQGTTTQLQQVWSCPYQVLLCVISLFFILGWSAIPAAIVMAVVVPLNMAAAKVIEKSQSRAMAAKDQRAKIVSEVLGGVKVVKLYAWEKAMESRINDVREHELQMIKRASIAHFLVDAFNNSTPFIIAVLCFGMFTFWSGEQLTPQTAFVAMTLFEAMRLPMIIVAYVFDMIVQVRVSNKRLKDFLTSEELDESIVERAAGDSSSLSLSSVSAAWPGSPSTLTDLSVQSQRGSLLAVVGRVGSGKSSLISALLGEMIPVAGRIHLHGNVAYVPQQPWIQNLSLKDNILFGNEFDEKFYNKVVSACALETDFNILPNGDETVIGDKGITLSGGQRARVSLARAVYSRCDVYLLDDPLAAVDAHVGRHIYEKVLGPRGLLNKATRLLVTHGLTYVRDADEILVMEGGKVVESGTYSELSEQKGAFFDFLEEYKSSHHEEDDEEDQKGRGETAISDVIVKVAAPPENNQETVETGRVSPSIYSMYIRAASLPLSIVFAIFVMTFMLLGALRSLWLSVWSSDKNDDNIVYRLSIYSAIGATECICLLCGSMLLVFAALSASRRLHSPLVANLLRAPMSFYDTTPLGRILNRCTKDIEVIDSVLPEQFYNLLYCGGQVVFTLLVIIISTPAFLIVIPPLIAMYFYVLRFYVPTSRQLRRIESVFRSPIFAHFGETVQGASCIRAFDKVGQFESSSGVMVDELVKCRLASIQANRWLAIRLELLGNCIIVFASLFAVLSNELGWVTSPSLLAVSVTYALNVTDVLNWTVRCVSEIEASIVAVERVNEHSTMKQEAAWDIVDADPNAEWPQKGEVSIQDYSTRYRDELDLVLRGVSAEISAGEKVGIVGRTGAGKSSLVLALFRVVEAVKGRILIDGVDIAKIGLHRLRNAVTIIPQEPVLLSGTLRFNLDPLGERSDAELWRAAEMAHLGEFLGTIGGLDAEMAEGGENISVGQRQLVCLCRALLRRTRLLLLDEATAAVDVATDALIQATIREHFASCTVLTIAHRLNTIMDYDRIMVLSGGLIAEMGSPSELLATDSIFSEMVKESRRETQ